MGEKIVVIQDSEFRTAVLAQDPNHPESPTFQQIKDMQYLTPYGMLLAGLGSCTAIVMHTYAHHHDIALQQVELHLEYDRFFEEDCEECESIHEYQERIREKILLSEELSTAERQRLFKVSQHCPIHKMLSQGIEVDSHLEE